MIDEILSVKGKYKLKTVMFGDDTFVVNLPWVLKFLKAYREQVGLPFICQLRANLINDEIVKALSEAGCTIVFFGVESGNEYIRNKILKKGVSNQQIVKTGRLLHKYGIKFRTYNMFGMPGESIRQAFDTVHINQAMKTNFPYSSLLHPYPKTELWDMLVANNAISSEFSPDDVSQSYWSKSPIKQSKEIVNLQRLFFFAVKFPVFEPVIKKMIKFRPNRVYDLLFLMGHAYTYVGSEAQDVMSVSSVKFAWRIIKDLIFD